MRSTAPFNLLNQQFFSTLCSSSYPLSLRRTHALLCSSHSPHFSSLQSGSSMEESRVANQGSATHDSIAIRSDHKSYSYNQLISSVSRISRLLSTGELNDGKIYNIKYTHQGARIGIVAKPSAEFVAGILGAWLSGGVAIPLALSYPEPELLHVINDSDISMILSTEEHMQLIENVAAKCVAQTSLIPPVPSSSSPESGAGSLQAGGIDADADAIFHRNIKQSSEDPALVIYTSGTTGKTKGVVHTHKSISAQGYTSADQFLNCLPLHHILQFLYKWSETCFNGSLTYKIHVHGLFNAVLALLYAGSTVEFMPKFSARGIWQTWREAYPINGSNEDGITVFTGVPTMYTRLIQAHEAMDPELKAASAYVAKQLRLMFVMVISNPLRGERKSATVGKPFPGVEVKIVAEDESGSDAIGMGELCVKSPSLFKEYWKLPEVTKQSFTSDGYFRTGDAGTMDEDGYYIILGRTRADIMKVGGYKLYALEIESVLLQHPAVEECCVLGLPDRDYGEVVCAIIVPEAETKKKQKEELKPAISLEELSFWAKDKLAPYKIPTRLILWDSLPRNAMGKVNKKELKKTLAPDQST
ncbi:malonate--CoA ligase [Pyrus ussuriensis x Pyrus communis]|uniref:Malonate--CoA ligase n=1 Tax=Pyrus ussuriensis x Pyrus communis TaxID=2448454 RepID=A0A5N5G7A9_9ROSA|nr:malonate--CoA ligase [Pyrus ussuriensis x Pyrus communis]